MKVYLNSYYQKRDSLVHLWEYDTETTRIVKSKHEFVPYFFLDAEEGEESTLESAWGKRVVKQSFDSFKEMSAFLQDAKKNIPEKLHENDVNPPELQFLVERYKDIPIEDRSINAVDIPTAFVDIETLSDAFPNIETTPDPINLVTIYRSKDKHYYTYTYKDIEDIEAFKAARPPNSTLIRVTTERHLLEKVWEEIDAATIITGWYSNGFDFPYIINRSTKLQIDHHGYCRKMKNGSFYISIFGKILIDYLEIYKKLSYKSLGSHRLAVVAQAEKLKGKMTLNPAASGSHRTMYEEYFDDYVLYNIRDVEIMVELEERYEFFTMLAILTCQSLCKMENTVKMVRLIESFLIQFMRENNMVMPRFSPSKKVKYPGAYVKEPVPGKYGWIIDFDVVSMYPTHTIVGNYSFETYLGKLYGLQNDIRMPYDMFSDQQVNDFIKKCEEVSIVK